MSLSRINPVSKLYRDLNLELGKDDVKELRHILTGNQISKREMESLDDAASMFRRLEEKGAIARNNLRFLKDILIAIDRKPLVVQVEECELEVQRMRIEDGLSEPQKTREVMHTTTITPTLRHLRPPVDGNQQHDTATCLTSHTISSLPTPDTVPSHSTSHTVSRLPINTLQGLLTALKPTGGQVDFKGRCIVYEVEETFSGSGTYTCTAWDVECGTSWRERNVSDCTEGLQRAMTSLVQQLQVQGILSP
ncbi:uncharacterized protein LOC144444571 [Glandiceps talaboti]